MMLAHARPSVPSTRLDQTSVVDARPDAGFLHVYAQVLWNLSPRLAVDKFSPCLDFGVIYFVSGWGIDIVHLVGIEWCVLVEVGEVGLAQLEHQPACPRHHQVGADWCSVEVDGVDAASHVLSVSIGNSRCRVAFLVGVRRYVVVPSSSVFADR